MTALPDPTTQNRWIIAALPAGAQCFALAQMVATPLFAGFESIMHVALSDKEAKSLVENLPFFAPDAQIIHFPAWDCLPYDRVCANAGLVAERIEALRLMLAAKEPGKKRIVVTTINAILQKLPPRDAIRSAHFELVAGKEIRREKLLAFFTANGYSRASKAVEAGEYAVRGSIIDIMMPDVMNSPPSKERTSESEGIRLDLFGDDIETIRRFDPMTQLSAGQLESVTLYPMSEAIFSDERIERFRARYREHFGTVQKEDPLYESVSNAARYPGMEHWLPLFYERLETLFDYLPGTLLTLDSQAEQAISDRFETIRDYYGARLDAKKLGAKSGAVYNPLVPDALYVMEPIWRARLESTPVAWFSAFEGDSAQSTPVHLNVKAGINLAGLRKDPSINPFQQLQAFAGGKREGKKSTVLACLSEGSRERLSGLLGAQELHCIRIDHFSEIRKISGKSIGLCVLPLEHGFETSDFAIITEQDLLGERIIRAKPKRRKSEAFLAEAANFLEGELVVHREHGIGRFDGLVTLEVMGAQHDCLKLAYADNDRLFLPVENIDLLTRYGSEEDGAKLDKLGGAGWQARKAKLKDRIKIAAEQLLKTAAEREIQQAPELDAQAQAYAAFCARFPYMETEDQERSIQEVVEDLRSGHPMDRLICGDVGFGKTEVALRAAFVATHAEPEKMQVALIAPTTLLVRQHYKNFKARFEGFDVRVRHLSRLVTAKEQKETREGLKNGDVDIVVGTHALLAKGMEFKNLGLVIVDEEQHFGVGQKEKLKELKHNVHVLTLSATPIPRTLQMALSGVRSLSLITTPPVDRLAVRSFVMPFDPVVLREAIMRERHRGGKVFLVTPHIDDIADLKNKMRELVPEIKIAVAHGQMPPSDLDTIMNEFYDGKFDMLISTAIIESGLDIPTANTMIIHRADRFGLAQLYQLRGRVGRGKIRAYAYFLLPQGKVLAHTATRRLEVMKTLDSLGAGFSLASHDMDIRGFGNLVGEEQSGHIREVGIELYQQMLMEAVAALKANGKKRMADDGKSASVLSPSSSEGWSPQINLGMSVLIPEHYVSDLQLRLGLYRRAANLKDEAEIDSMAAELIDRFGKMPEEVEHLFAIVRIKQLCQAAGVERLDAGPKGAVLTFRRPYSISAEKLLAYIGRNPTRVKLRPDEKLFYAYEWRDIIEKIAALKALLTQLGAL